MKVAKFGGSSLADAGQITKVVNIVKSDPTRRIVVVSAPGKRFSGDIKVTDLLIALAKAVLAGKVYETDDALNTDVQSMYGVWDNTGVANVTASAITGGPSALQKQTLTASGNSYTVDNKTVDYAVKRGWYLDLDTVLSTGERITIDPQVYYDEVIFTSIIPAGATDTCSSDGKSTTFILRALTGGIFPYPVFDTTGDGKVDSSDTLIAGKQGTLTFGTTILQKGNKSIIYQPPSSGSTDVNGPKPTKMDISQGANPATRVWKQLLRTD